MYRYVLFIWLCWGFNSIAFAVDIRENAHNYGNKEQPQCVYDYGYNSYDVGKWSALTQSGITNLAASQCTQSLCRVGYSFDSPVEAADCSTVRLNYTYRERRPDPQGGFKYQDKGSATQSNGRLGTAYACPPENNPAATHRFENRSGGVHCLVPSELPELDSCNGSGNGTDGGLSAMSENRNAKCFQRDDGSFCKADYAGWGIETGTAENRSETFFFNLSRDDSGGCYGSQTSTVGETVDEQNHTPTQECAAWGAGVVQCNRLATDVCDSSGNCRQGCGRFSVGGGADHFMCFEKDSDNDTIPDSEDPDKDNDGIPNESDSDDDGDGIPNADDPDHPDYGNGSGGGSTGGEGGGTGTGTGGDVINVDLRGVEQKLDEIDDRLGSDFTVGKGRGTGDFSKLFGDEEIEKLQAEIVEKKEDLQKVITDINDEASTFFSFNTPSATFENHSFNVRGVDISRSMSDFNEIWVYMGFAFMFAATVSSVFIVMGGVKW